MKQKTKKTSPKKYSISVTGKMYDRLHASTGETSVPKFVDGLLVSALNDPILRAQVLEKCRARESVPLNE